MVPLHYLQQVGALSSSFTRLFSDSKPLQRLYATMDKDVNCCELL